MEQCSLLGLHALVHFMYILGTSFYGLLGNSIHIFDSGGAAIALNNRSVSNIIFPEDMKRGSTLQ